MCFHEFWTRRQSYIQYVYCLHGDAEFEKLPRPEYELFAKHRRPDVVKSQTIDDLPKWREILPAYEKGEYKGGLVYSKVVLKKERYWRVALSMALSIFFVAVNIGIIVGVKWLQGKFVMLLDGIEWDEQKLGPLKTVITQEMIGVQCSTVVSLVMIIVLTKVFGKVVEYITEFEQPRTDSDLHDSTVSKIYMFQFINFYGTLFFSGNIV